MEIKYVKTTGVTLMGEVVWDGYSAIANGKTEFEIRKVKSKWHLVKKNRTDSLMISQRNSEVMVVFKTLREAKAQFEKAMERKYENRT